MVSDSCFLWQIKWFLINYYILILNHYKVTDITFKLFQHAEGTLDPSKTPNSTLKLDIFVRYKTEQ